MSGSWVRVCELDEEAQVKLQNTKIKIFKAIMHVLRNIYDFLQFLRCKFRLDYVASSTVLAHTQSAVSHPAGS